MKRPAVYLAVILLLLTLPSLALGYQAAIEASSTRNEVAKGETFTYKLSIIEEGQADQPANLVPPDFTGFRVTGTFSSTSVKVIQNKARSVTEQEYRLSSEIPGEHVIPPAKIVLTDPKTGQRREMTSNPVKVAVLAKGPGILKGIEEDIRDIKAPKTFIEKVRFFFLGMMAIAVLVLFIITGLVIYMVRRRKKAAPAAGAPVQTALPARDEALEALRRAEALMPDTKAFYSAASGSVRRYLKAAHGIPAPEATTTEIMESAGKTAIPQHAKEALRALLDEADLVKFAKYAPTDDDKRRFIGKARALVGEI